MTDRLRFFAPCPPGVEALLADELRRLGLKGVRPQRSGVLFAGTAADGARAVYWSRLASRVLLTLTEVDASSADVFYAGVREIAWEDHVRAGGTIAVDAGGVNDALRNTQFTAVRTKDAIADRFRERFGRRPSVDVRSPDLRVNVAVRAGKATVSIDLAGEPLHRRGYREPGVQVAAPMKETLAAAVLGIAGWREVAESGGGFVDPMCGSGTLAIEAALGAGDIAPGLLRREHPIERWLGLDTQAWQRMTAEAAERRQSGMAALPPILASDSDPHAVDIARRFVRRAGLESVVRVTRAELDALAPPTSAAPGLIATNPPWGERLSERSALPALYAKLAGRLGGFEGWRLAVVSPDPDLAGHLGLKPAEQRVLGTGKGAATVTVFDVVEPSRQQKERSSRQPRRGESRAPSANAGTQIAGESDWREVSGADAFANRVAKMARHYGKWARRVGVSCYRVYDADLPDFAVAVDLYEGAGPDEGARWVNLAEYAAPAHIDAQVAAERLSAAAAATAEMLEVPSECVFVKRRERQRGASQYERRSRRGVRGTIAEGGLLFEVNFTDYLDTGIFLDHRDTRARLRESAAGKRFLNLFAYTGSATVYAAAGGAVSSTTVDLSPTYLAWAERNLALNGLEGAEHRVERADGVAWLEAAAQRPERFELVFCDPPTFSNSKRMETTFDVQRDHLGLITAINEVLADDGLIVFSCNRKGFVLDAAGLSEAGLVVVDITARTIPRDFERTTGVHRCWEVRRA